MKVKKQTNKMSKEEKKERQTKRRLSTIEHKLMVTVEELDGGDG